MSRHRHGPSTTLYVRNIPDRVRHEEIKRVFSKYGRVLDVTIPLDYQSGASKGYAFVEYDDLRDAEEAQYKMDRSRLFGRDIDVEFARGIKRTPSEMRNRDRDHRYRSRSGERRGGRSSRSRSGDRARRSDKRSDRRRSRSRGGDSRSASPRQRDSRERSRSGSRRSPKNMDNRATRSRSRSASPV